MTGTWILGIVGLIVLIGGALCLYQAVRAQREVHAMMAAETLTVPELEELRGIANGLGARFQKVAEVVGTAAPGPQGLLRAEMSGVESVWHAQRVQRHYEETETDSDGDTRTTRRTETVAQNVSGPTFTLVRDGHAVVVDHGGRLVDAAEQVVDRFEQAHENRGFLRGLVHRDGTIGFQYTEWVVRPGTPLYVLGEVHDRTGELVVGPPADRAQHFVVSTRSEEELTDATRRHQRLMARIGAGAGTLGVVLLALAVVVI
jgi:hypothetical protein